jgi:hypothetical protein
MGVVFSITQFMETLFPESTPRPRKKKVSSLFSTAPRVRSLKKTRR